MKYRIGFVYFAYLSNVVVHVFIPNVPQIEGHSLEKISGLERATSFEPLWCN